MSLIELTICREGEGRTVTELLPAPRCFAHPNLLRPDCADARVTFFAPGYFLKREGGWVAVLAQLHRYRNIRRDRFVIEGDGDIPDLDHPDIGMPVDLRPDGDYFFFLQQRLGVNLDRGFIQAVTENRGLSDSSGQTLREDIARLIITESSMGRILRAGNFLKVYDLLQLIADRSPVDTVLACFSRLAAVYPSLALVRIVAGFFSRVVAFQCGNKTYLKSLHGKIIRTAATNFEAPEILSFLNRLMRSPLEPEARFVDLALRAFPQHHRGTNSHMSCGDSVTTLVNKGGPTL